MSNTVILTAEEDEARIQALGWRTLEDVDIGLLVDVEDHSDSEAIQKKLQTEREEIVGGVRELLSIQEKFQEHILHVSVDPTKDTSLKARAALYKIRVKLHAALHEYEQRTHLLMWTKRIAWEEERDELAKRTIVIEREMLYENNKLAQENKMLMRDVSRTEENFRDARNARRIPNLGTELVTDRDQLIEKNWASKSLNRLLPADLLALEAEIKIIYAEDINNQVEVSIPIMNINTPSVMINALFNRDKTLADLCKFQLVHVFCILEAYGKPLPPTLEQYRIFLDDAAWNPYSSTGEVDLRDEAMAIGVAVRQGRIASATTPPKPVEEAKGDETPPAPVKKQGKKPTKPTKPE